MSMTDLSIIIPNFNGKHFLKLCLESLKVQDNSFDVIIVDNGSTDGSVRFVKDNYPDYTLIENKENLGFSAGVNQGIKASSSEYVFLLNNDTEIESNCILNLLGCMMKDEDIFAVASKMIQSHDRSKLDDAGDEYTILGWTRKTGDGKSSNLYKDERDIFSACAGAALYRKCVFDEIGYFDEAFFAYLEDVDISYRARIQGYRCVYCPKAIVYHRTSQTTGSRYNEFKIKTSARNNVFLIYKNMPLPQKVVNFVFLLVGFTIKYIFFLRKGQGKFYLEGLKEGLNSRDKVDKIEYKNKNLKNYFKIEWLLIKNTIKFITL